MAAQEVSTRAAVTVTEIVFVPTSKLIGDDADPLVTAMPFTLTVALLWATVGVTVILVTLLATEDV